MYVLGLDSAVPDDCREALLAVLGERWSLCLITAMESVADHPQATVSGAYASDGSWMLQGEGASRADLLERVAGTCDVAVIEGEPVESWPWIEVIDGTLEAPELSLSITPEAFDAEAVATALADTEPLVTLDSMVTDIKSHPQADRAGAIATFTGRVRAKDTADDTPTEHLEFERYGDVADRTMETIATELADRDGVVAVDMHHRTGVIPAGVDIVFVVVLAGHRSEAFRTVEDGINRLKAEVPIFKKEVTVEDEFWVHTRP